MAQYINKDALVAEIERIKKSIGLNRFLSEYEQGCNQGKEDMCDGLFSFIDTLEVKDVDLEEKISEWMTCGNITDTRYDNYWDGDIIETAKYFFELGLKAQKGK